MVGEGESNEANRSLENQNRRVTSTNSRTVKNSHLNWKLYNFTLFTCPFHIYS